MEIQTKIYIATLNKAYWLKIGVETSELWLKHLQVHEELAIYQLYNWNKIMGKLLFAYLHLHLMLSIALHAFFSYFVSNLLSYFVLLFLMRFAKASHYIKTIAN